MSKLDQKIDALIRDFATELNSLVREAALEAVREALGESGGSAAVRAPVRRKASTSGAKTARSSRGGRKTRSKRTGKRSPRQINSMMARIMKFVESNPGQSIADIAKALGTETRDLTLPMRKLKAEGLVRTQGQKRATRYYAVKRRKTA